MTGYLDYLETWSVYGYGLGMDEMPGWGGDSSMKCPDVCVSDLKCTHSEVFLKFIFHWPTGLVVDDLH